MKRNGFTLIELLAVIVILAIIALIVTPIVVNIIRWAKEESQERSVELYASAVKTGIAAYQLREGKGIVGGTYTSETLPFDIEYDGNVECGRIDLYEDGGVYVEDCKINGDVVEYTYGTYKGIPKPKSFAEDDWSTIIANVQAVNLSKYKVGDKKEIQLKPFKSASNPAGLFTIRISNTSSPKNCYNPKFSKTACGFVIEFEGIIASHPIDSKTDGGGWETSSIRTFINENIYKALPIELRDIIIPTQVVSGKSTTSIVTTDNLYLLSAVEIYNLQANDATIGLTRQLDYYSSLNITPSNEPDIAKIYNGEVNRCWLRSTKMGVPEEFNYVDTIGNLGNSIAFLAYGISVAFRIG